MRILYVDTLLHSGKVNSQGRIKAYKKHGKTFVFDYRAVFRKYGKNLPWSRPEIWHEKDWGSRIFSALYNMNATLIDFADKVQPDLVQFGKGEVLFGLTAREIKKRTGAIIVHFYGDLPLEWQQEPVKYWVRDIGREADLTLLYHWDTRIIRSHLQAGCNRVGSWGVGIDMDMYYPRNIRKIHDVVFIGNNQKEDGQHRLELFEALAKSGLGVHVFGGNWEKQVKHKNIHVHEQIYGDTYAEICSSAGLILSTSSSKVRGYCSWDRPLRSMACGAPVLCQYFPGLEEVFKTGKHLRWFRTTREAVKFAHHYLDNQDLRTRMAEAGLQEVQKNHSWDTCIEVLLNHVDEIKTGHWEKGTGRLRNGTEVKCDTD